MLTSRVSCLVLLSTLAAVAGPAFTVAQQDAVGARLRQQGSAPQPARPWPSAANTGIPAGVALSLVNGDLEIKNPGTVVDGKYIRGCVHVTAPGVVIRRSRVHCNFAYAIESNGYTGTRLLIEDSEIDCSDDTGKGTRATAVGDNNFTARRLNIHHCENGFDVDVDVTIQDNWIHDLTDHPEAHSDGIQFAIGRNVLVEHNAIYVIGTSAIISHPATMDGVVIRDNLLAGGAFTLYCPRERSNDVHVVGNRFSRALYPGGGAYGAWTDCHRIAELRDNVWDDTGRPLAGQPIPRPPRH